MRFYLVAVTIHLALWNATSFIRKGRSSTTDELQNLSMPENNLSHSQYARIDMCPTEGHIVWEEWKQCISSALSTKSNESFQGFILENGPRLPWSRNSNHTAVLLEFRDVAPKMALVIANIMDNLPLQWRVQVLGGTLVCKLLHQLFPHEIAAGKIVVTLIDMVNVDQVMWRTVLPMLTFTPIIQVVAILVFWI